MGRERGFSLTEALVAAALLAVLLIAAVPYLATPDTLEVRAPARELAADLRLAQRLAIARRANFLVEFVPAGGPYTSYTVRQEGGAAEPDFPKTLPAGVTVTGPGQFAFRPDGSAAAGGTTTLTAGVASANVEVTAATGRVRVVGP